MGVTTSNKELSTTSIKCGGAFTIKLSLAAEPDIVSNPTDIVLVLDRSISMAGSPMANLKSGAKRFIQIIDESTDGAHDGNIGNGSHIGIVSFASTATQDTQLITSVADLNAAVNALSADGFTNHADAFEKAVQLFDPASTNEKVIVMFTDGVTTTGGDSNAVATAAKAQGIIIYCIGLSGNGGVDEQALNDWASDPDSAYVAITPDDEELDKLFEDLARNISKPGATNIVITDNIAPCFKITSLSAPTKGTASLLDANSLRWKIDELGVSKSEGAVLEFIVEYDAGELGMESLGRILQLSVTLKNVCPHKRVALAAIVTEVGCDDAEYKRGMKIMTIPAHSGDSCRDVTVRCIKFVLPEDLDIPHKDDKGICGKRRFKARFIAHYIDNDFDCCNVVI